MRFFILAAVAQLFTASAYYVTVTNTVTVCKVAPTTTLPPASTTKPITSTTAPYSTPASTTKPITSTTTTPPSSSPAPTTPSSTVVPPASTTTTPPSSSPAPTTPSSSSSAPSPTPDESEYEKCVRVNGNGAAVYIDAKNQMCICSPIGGSMCIPLN
ncbi:hypothetical protein BB558_000120 [Smittium angustum]|uniref:EGF-like domain-containing protein n=1 Tax=Smittium angustum TaxID=133377 RepID=A0A2U1JFB2_SMIAN|nr:hypothetical protein BB558_000120 [Smittium angustum]